MTIRYKCPKCHSVLKIKDELAGTDGKCPKCKSRFVIPDPQAESEDDAEQAPDKELVSEELAPAAAAAPAQAAAPPAATPKKSRKGSDDDFDVDSFLMDDSAPNAKASAGLASSPPPSAAPQKPTTDRFGRRQIVAPPPTPAGGDLNPAVNASANARDLLTKNMADARVRASELPEARQRGPLFDWSGAGQQLKSIAPYVLGTIVLVIGLFWIMNRMLGSRLPVPQLARVTGKVTLDGQPLSNVTVYLTPLDMNGKATNGKSIRLRDAYGTTDTDGNYRVYYVAGEEGAPLGRVRIWVRPNSPVDVQKIPGQYQLPGQDTREVREAGNDGNFNLELKSR